MKIARLRSSLRLFMRLAVQLALIGMLACLAHSDAASHDEGPTQTRTLGVHQQHDEHQHTATHCTTTTTKDRRAPLDTDGPAGGRPPQVPTDMSTVAAVATFVERPGHRPTGRQRLLLTSVSRN